MRRVVTGHRDGKSVILEDEEIAFEGEVAGTKTAALWKTSGTPTIPSKEAVFKSRFFSEFPEPEETTLGIIVRPPHEEILREAKEKGINIFENHRKRFGDEYPMHTTDTIDYIIIISGEVWMEVDDGAEVHLKAGDFVIQNGTRHAWRNRSSEDCVAAFITIGAKREKSNI